MKIYNIITLDDIEHLKEICVEKEKKMRWKQQSN